MISNYWYIVYTRSYSEFPVILDNFIKVERSILNNDHFSMYISKRNDHGHRKTKIKTKQEKSKIRKDHVSHIPSPLSPTSDFLFFVLTHSHGHHCSTDLGTSSKKMAAIWEMSHRLPKLSFLFPEVEDFLRNALFPREVIYKAFILLQW